MVFRCGTCWRSFYAGWRARDQHCEVVGHARPEFECDTCDEYFDDEHDRREHMDDEAHWDQDAVECMYCDLMFLERGACPRAPLDRDKLYRVIRQYDSNSTISKNLLEWEGTRTYEATGRAWNAHCEAYECYICHSLFLSLTSLNQHLASPKHQQALYHCPNPSCRKDFSTLGGAVNHWESESCGFMRFQAVQKNVQRIVNPSRMISFQ
ncbi:Fc.00g093420.m01.CDS01 [Cosmosporella sp. VM-42]